MWKTVQLDEIVNLSIGKTPSRGNAKFWDKDKLTKNIWLSIADLTALEGLYVGDSKEYVSDEGADLFRAIPPETLVMSFKLSIGKLAITKCELRTNEAIAALPIKDEKIISKKFLYYYLSAIDWEDLAGNDVKVKGKTLNKAKLKEISISFPLLPEQQRIVAKLDAAFAEIDRAIKRTNQKESDVVKLKDSLLCDFLREDETMWKSTTLGEYYDVRDGTHDSPKYVKDGFPLVTSKNLKDGKIDLSKIKYISEKDYREINLRSAVSVGDVLMGMIGTIGNPVEIVDPPRFAIKNVALFKTNAEQSPAYLRYFLSHPHIISRMMKDAKGATQKFVGLGYLRNFPILVPPLAEQKRIVAKLDAVYNELENANESIRKSKENYEALKSAILAQELQPRKAA